MPDLTIETIAELRARHVITCEQSGDACDHLPTCTIAICAHCADSWPCDAAQLLDALAEADTRYTDVLDKAVQQKLRALSAEQWERVALQTEWRPALTVPGAVAILRAALDPNGDHQ